METKVCTKKGCIHNGNPQPISNFNKCKKSPDGYRSDCKDCRKKETAYQNKEYMKTHRESIKLQKKRWRHSLAKYATYYEKIKLYEECRQDPDNSELIQVKCKYCGIWFTPLVLQITNRLFAISKLGCGETNLYCSDSCKRACPTYKQVVYHKDYKPESPREVQPSLRKLVLERDNWTCQKCGINKKNNSEVELHCHHIDPVSQNPIESADIDNCVTLCKNCHKEVHNLPKCQYHNLKCKK